MGDRTWAIGRGDRTWRQDVAIGRVRQHVYDGTYTIGRGRQDVDVGQGLDLGLDLGDRIWATGFGRRDLGDGIWATGRMR